MEKLENVKVFASIIDDATKKQIEEAATCEAYNGCAIRIMPDCHAGSGCTIGSVIKFKDRVVPNTVGVDIGCGMLVTCLGNVEIDLAEIDRVVTEKIPSGFEIHETEKDNFPITIFNAEIKQDESYIQRSIGTLGGGNHFIELDADDEGNKYLVIHSGSRNLGVQVCNYWQNKAFEKLNDHKAENDELIARLKAEGREKDINKELKNLKRNPKTKKELSYIEGSDLLKYLKDMVSCQEYAVLNRKTMASIICEELGLKPIEQFTTIHNYIEIESGIIRKGAISAKKGEKVLIPMNMRDGSLICIGKGNEDWLCSAPHGAGRIMSRAEAFRSVDIDDFKKSMEGIYTTSVCDGTLDEAPIVYKSADIIRKDIEPTVEIVKVIKPLWNFKAKTSESR